VLLEGMRTEYDPGLQSVRDLLPTLGRLRRVSFRYSQRSSRYDNVLAGDRVNIFDPAMAGGALYDLGVYCIHPLISLFGAPTRVFGESVLVDTGADGAGVALAVYPDFVADLAFSKITSSDLPSELQGENATLTIDQIASPRLLRLTDRDGQVTEHQVSGPPRHGLHGEVARFVALIESGQSAARDQTLTLEMLRVIDKLRAARG
jgi:predicted dehydrogenase